MSLLSSSPTGQVRAKLIALGALVVIAAAVISMMHGPSPTTSSTPTALTIGPFEVMGIMAAKQTQKLAGPTGNIAIWQIADAPTTPITLRTLVHAYNKEIAQNPGLHIVAREEEHVDFQATREKSGVQVLSARQFLALLSKYHSADVLVLLGDNPVLGAADYAKLPPHRPRVLAVDLMGTPSRKLFDEHVLQAAIISRYPPSTTAEATTAQEWVDKYYMLVTPENTENLPP